MAEFSDEELIDCIRHNIAILDDSGLTNRVLLPSIRRSVGGLPLQMCKGRSKEAAAEEEPSKSLLVELECVGKQSNYGRFFVESSEQASSSKDQQQQIQREINEQLLGQLEEMERSGRFNRAALPLNQRPVNCTLRFEPRYIREEKRSVSQSLASRLISREKLADNSANGALNSCLAEFAKFEAMDGSSNSKCFNILFPGTSSDDENRCVLRIHVARNACISDLIGLACHVYTRKALKPPCDSPSNYDLYLAEEDLSDYDTELPPQDRRRRVANCGFPNLAMVKRSLVRGLSSDKINQIEINIYLVDGRKYTMEVDGLDISLRQVFDYALRRKNEEDHRIFTETESQVQAFFGESDYQLEPLTQPGVVLSLDESVSSSGTSEFVLIRKNSSRGDLGILLASRKPSCQCFLGAAVLPLQHKQSKSMDFAQLFLGSNANGVVGTNEVNATVGNSSLLAFQHSMQTTCPLEAVSIGMHQTSADLMNQIAMHLDGGAVIGEFLVNKIRRFQSKAPTKLVVRENCLELISITSAAPKLEETKKSSTTSLGKLKEGRGEKFRRIPWELVASAEVPPHSEKGGNVRRFVRITFLNNVSPLLIQHIVEAGKRDLPRDGNALYENACWKVLTIETAASEAWQIGVKLNELLESRHSQVQLLYHYSSGASLKPKQAAEKAFGESGSKQQQKLQQNQIGPSASSSGISREFSLASSGEKGFRKKLSAILSRKRL